MIKVLFDKVSSKSKSYHSDGFRSKYCTLIMIVLLPPTSNFITAFSHCIKACRAEIIISSMICLMLLPLPGIVFPSTLRFKLLTAGSLLPAPEAFSEASLIPGVYSFSLPYCINCSPIYSQCLFCIPEHTGIILKRQTSSYTLLLLPAPKLFLDVSQTFKKYI